MSKVVKIILISLAAILLITLVIMLLSFSA